MFELPFALSVPYPDIDTVSSYWGSEVTATIDWCEENNVISYYIAEFVNTITNSFFMFLACFAILRSVQNGFEKRFILGNCGFLLVGIGSWLFHMTLMYEFQLLDELPMLYATCVPFWSIFSKGKSPKQTFIIGVLVTTLAGLMTAIYLIIKDPTFHQACYAFLNFMIIGKSYHTITTSVDNVKYKKEISTMIMLMVKGVGSFLFGYFLWNLDIHLCSQVTQLKRFVGLPYGFLLEGHGWWHLFTGLGVYHYDIFLEYLRLFEIGKQDDYCLTTKFYILPDIETKDRQVTEKKES
ncbi:alkaline dihydroceramidase [Saccharomycopsis crataegensis]|uniref:Alkaline dihydroceramidase n=1 Tax=Saccharomycopsis crataegensis TaxID=43959 RepID=A0AAV5QKN5_9ASCO|nr:alkaline dihydroceramidase [Saccharomycopsis crataegensis]